MFSWFIDDMTTPRNGTMAGYRQTDGPGNSALLWQQNNPVSTDSEKSYNGIHKQSNGTHKQ